MTANQLNPDWNIRPHHFTDKEVARIHQGLPPWESLSFGCGGWLQFYLFGVAKAIQVCGLNEGVRYYGCSAGALAAGGLVVRGEFNDAIKFCKDHCLPTAYGRADGLFLLSKYVSECIKDNILPNIPADGIPDNVLNVAVTKLPFLTGEVISKFDSTDDVVLSLLASCAAFPLASLVNKQGQWYIDGGISSFQPVEDENTVTVSALYFSDCDIKPSRYVPLWWSFMPPKCENTVDWLYSLGYEDAIAYFVKRGLHINEALVQQHKPKKVDHPYDEPRRVSIHRLLGYQWSDLSRFTILSLLVDTFLMLFLVVIVKPILLLLIYLELAVRMGILLGCSITHTFQLVWQSYYRMLLSLFSLQVQFQWMRYQGKKKMDQFLSKNKKQQEAAEAMMMNPYQQLIQEMLDCFQCIMSISLLLRILSRPLPHAVIQKHDKLYKCSMVYRVARHIL